MGLISDVYGALQATVAVLQFLKGGTFLSGPDDIEKVKEEIEKTIKQEVFGAQFFDIVGHVNGVIDNLKLVRSDPDNVNNRSLLVNVVTQGTAYFDIIDAIIGSGDMKKIYMLAPAFNGVGPALAMAIKALDYPQAEVARIIQKVQQYNYNWVGADLVESCASGDLRTDASIGKTFWKKWRYSSVNCGYIDGTPAPEWKEVCDVNDPPQCWYTFCRGTVNECVGTAKIYREPVCRPDEPCFTGMGPRQLGPFKLCYDRALSVATHIFNNDNTIDLIKVAMSAASAADFGIVSEPKPFPASLADLEWAVLVPSFNHDPYSQDNVDPYDPYYEYYGPPSRPPRRLRELTCFQDQNVPPPR